MSNKKPDIIDILLTLAGSLVGKFAVGFVITMGVLLAIKIMGMEI